MNIDKLLHDAVFKGLGLNLDLTVHSMIRYAERFCGVNVKGIRSKWLADYGTFMREGRLFHEIKSQEPGLMERIKDDLRYLTQGHTETFEDDNVRFCISDDYSLITVYEL